MRGRECVCVVSLLLAFPADFPLTCSGGVFWLLDPTNEGTRVRERDTAELCRASETMMETLKTDLLLLGIYTLSLTPAIATLAAGRGGGEEVGH